MYKRQEYNDRKEVPSPEFAQEQRLVLEEQYARLKLLEKENIIEALNYNKLLELLKLGVVVMSHDELISEDPDTPRNVHEFLFLASSETTRHLKLANRILDLEQTFVGMITALAKISESKA